LPSSFRAAGLSQFTKHISTPPSNAAEGEAYAELSDAGNLVIKSGWPDFMVVSGPNEIFLVEVKGPGDEIRPHQRVVLEFLARAGINTYIRWPDGYEAIGSSIPWEQRV
jgi:hypothetical protein